MLHAIGGSLNNRACFNVQKSGEDNHEASVVGKRSKDDKPGWVMGTYLTHSTIANKMISTEVEQ
jgi:hypothetical protein